MILLTGPQALPDFRRRRLERDLSGMLDTPVGVTSSVLYVIDGQPLSPGRDLDRLLQLLDARAWAEPAAGALYVMPRAGTQSPWSSKATDILERCGFADLGRIEQGTLYRISGVAVTDLSAPARLLLHDRMTQTLLTGPEQLHDWFAPPTPRPLRYLELGDDPLAALHEANRTFGLALSDAEIRYLAEAYRELGRDPTDAELMMFAQANSEHCRHKIFNARWTIDGESRGHSLFEMIRHTHHSHPHGVLSAYHDNAAVLSGFDGQALLVGDDGGWHEMPARLHTQIKVETHNHPTAIAPFPGAATGSGGEIRDEAATGRGARSVAGLAGFTVSDLAIPGYGRSWETSPPPPQRLASALQIMLDGPIGAAAYNNEFGRPALGGYMRSFTAPLSADGAEDGRYYGYHKPVMIAGGMGTILDGQVDKQALRSGDRIIVLGGPAMLIGLGGGAASSMAAGESSEDLDFASVQRDNPEMQRRTQEVIDRCWGQGSNNPIRSIHDVGAGGISNAIPELLHDGGVGGMLELRAIPSADPGLSPMELWCNEAQERYVLAIVPERMEDFTAICIRERCPFAVLGEATAAGQLRVDDRLLSTPAVDLPLDVLLGRMPALHRSATRQDQAADWVSDASCDLDEVTLDDAVAQVLRVPAVASKQYLITIGDRTVGGLTVRDQMVGAWQVPVADCAVTLADYAGFAGSAMAMGERTPLAVHNAAASARMAVGEALTNLAGAPVGHLSRIRLSANWMAAAGEAGQDAELYAAVQAVGLELCPQLGIAIPVGKDSLSMVTHWNDAGRTHRMLAPVSLIVTAFATCQDVRSTITPELRLQEGATRLIAIDFSAGRMRLGGSALSYALRKPIGQVPDLEHAQRFREVFDAVQQLLAEGSVMACHDRSDGGLFVTLLEMGLAGHCGLEIDLTDHAQLLAMLFNEELGLVLQVREEGLEHVLDRVNEAAGVPLAHPIGRPAEHDEFVIRAAGDEVFRQSMAGLERVWAETSHALQRLRDDPACADEEYDRLARWDRPGLSPRLTFDAQQNVAAPYINTGARPAVAILREQGINGQREMAVVFMRAGFEAVDVHMTDLESGRVALNAFQGAVFCGGFSFGDVLGAGVGWARSILFNDRLREHFAEFLADPARFSLGVCNGCQALSHLQEIIPGTHGWPRFTTNRSCQFEGRLSMVRVESSPSIFFRGMEGSCIPIATAHGQGRALFAGDRVVQPLVALRYVAGDGQPAQHYPDNPNGSPEGVTGLTNSDGRVTILMPHPERLLRTVNFSWAPGHWGEKSPWMRMFENARAWVA